MKWRYPHLPIILFSFRRGIGSASARGVAGLARPAATSTAFALTAALVTAFTATAGTTRGIATDFCHILITSFLVGIYRRKGTLCFPVEAISFLAGAVQLCSARSQRARFIYRFVERQQMRLAEPPKGFK